MLPRFVYLFCLILLAPVHLFAQNNWSPRVVYWYKCNVAKQRNPSSKNYEYTIRPGGDFIFSGSVDEFDEALWSEYRKRRMVIGPFWDIEMAGLSIETYRNKFRRTPKMDEDINKEVFWYFIFIKQKRGYAEWKIKSETVFSGSLESFNAAIKIGSDDESVMIGPFLNEKAAQVSISHFSKLR